jgi:DNA-binding response OmpR family regulator
MTAPTASPARILVVDDDPTLATFVQIALAKEGHEVEVAHSGEAALARLQQGGIALVLLDISMPGIDGYETCRRIRADPATRAVRVIFLTSKDGLMDRGDGEDAGGDLYLTKPVSAGRLRSTVAQFLQRHGQ